jgi:ribonuclease P protein component
MAMRFTLGKNERLKSRKQIEQLFREGRKFSVTPFRIVFLVYETTGHSHSVSNIRFGVSAPAKYFKKAVDRNRIKRRTREAWRLQKDELAKQLQTAGKQMHIFFIYTGQEMPEYVLLSEKIKIGIQELIKAIERQ